mgnify:CR=1 FL=1
MILGLDNVFVNVQSLEKASVFFEKLGFVKKLSIIQIPAVLFAIGPETPGLIVCQSTLQTPSKVWVEVENAESIKNKCNTLGIEGKMLQTTTGMTFEIRDDSGNTIGFADYTKKPELARSKSHPDVKEIAEKYAHEVWNEKKLSAIDQFIDKDVVIHSLLGDYHGQEAMKDVVRAWLTGLPDMIVTNDAVLVDKDVVTIQWHAKGTHAGIFKGINPTGKKVSYSGVTIYRIKDDKIIEYWAYLDMQTLINQISGSK